MYTLKLRICFIKNVRGYSNKTSHKYVTPEIGFIGLGEMGFRMANNLVKAGKKIVIYDKVRAPIDLLVKDGAIEAASPKEVSASGAQVIITMLPSSPHVQSVYLNGEDSILAGAKPGQLYIDSSTIDPEVARSVQKALLEKGIFMIDAPVSGGVNGAQNKTLTFMVGGDVEIFNRAKETLALMGTNFIHCGGGGNGQVAKLANNLVLGITMIGVSEAMNLGITLGIDPKILAGIFNTSTARCWSSDTYNPVPGIMENVPSSRNYEGGFGVDLMAKDLSLGVIAAHNCKQPLVLGGAALQVYNQISSKGYGKKDFSSIYKYLSTKE
jgi:3-hydroxyisobutyrate dehydrogenase